MPSTTDGCPSITDADVDELVYQFLHSPYAGHAYVDWGPDQRLDGFLRHRGPVPLTEDGDAYGLILNRLMAYIAELRLKR